MRSELILVLPPATNKNGESEQEAGALRKAVRVLRRFKTVVQYGTQLWLSLEEKPGASTKCFRFRLGLYALFLLCGFLVFAVSSVSPDLSIGTAVIPLLFLLTTIALHGNVRFKNYWEVFFAFFVFSFVWFTRHLILDSASVHPFYATLSGKCRGSAGRYNRGHHPHGTAYTSFWEWTLLDLPKERKSKTRLGYRINGSRHLLSAVCCCRNISGRNESKSVSVPYSLPSGRGFDKRFQGGAVVLRAFPKQVRAL